MSAARFAAPSCCASAPPACRRADDFKVVDDPVPTPGPGEVVTRTLWLSIDPYMRGRLSTGNPTRHLPRSMSRWAGRGLAR